MDNLIVALVLIGLASVPLVALLLFLVMWSRVAEARRSLADLARRVERLERRPAPAPAPAPARSTPPPPAPGASRPAPAQPAAAPPAAVPPSPPPPVRPETPIALPPVPPHAAPELPRDSAPGPEPAGGLARRARAWLLGGNLVVRVGVIVLFFGVAFFLNYAIDRGWFPVALRLLLAALGGLGLVLVGWRLRDLRRDYALVLQGGGVGIVYLTVFAAANLYDLIAPGLGLLLMVALVATASGLAVVEDALSLAVLATFGGFLAPVLVGEGGGPVALFGYYAVLNAGVVAIAWFKAWHVLNLLGFACTFAFSAAWGREYYRPEYFASTEPFLVGFFLAYVAVPVLNVTRRPGRWTPRLDGTLLFGVPLAAFALQQPLVRDFEYGLATSALVAGVFYGALAWTLRRRLDAPRPLVDVFTALGAAFATLAIPLAFDGQITAAAWALEGAGLVWIGVRQQRPRARVAGILLQAAAGYMFLLTVEDPVRDVPVLNSICVGATLVSLAGLFSGWYLERHAMAPKSAPGAPTALLWWGLAWWLGAGLREIATHAAGADQVAGAAVFCSGTAVVAAWLRARLAWPALGVPPRLLLPALGVLALAAAGSLPHPFARWGAPAWIAALGAQAWIHRQFEGEWPERLSRFWYVGLLWLIVFLGTEEAVWLFGRVAAPGTAWRDVAWAIVPAAALAGLPVLATRTDWPGRAAGVALTGLLPVAGFLGIWIVVGSVTAGSPAPLPYVPLLNPLEAAQAAVLVLLLRWSRLGQVGLADRERWALWSILAFVALNGVIARATHFYGGVPFDGDALWASARYQTAVSIVWTTAALAAMLSARWFRERAVWFAGAALLALVVGKLFLVDLNDVGTIARIVSFVVVGLLILVVGYVSPLPPRAGDSA